MTDSQGVTNENAVLYITCSTSGFFVNESTDSTFDPANSIKYPVVYPTLMHLFIGVSPAFAEWYAKRVEEGDQTEKMRLEDLLCTLRPLPSSNVAASCWFGNSHSKDDTHDLFTYAETILEETELPFLSSEVRSRRDWLTEYMEVNLIPDPANAPLYLVGKENEFAEAAKRAAMRIVDGVSAGSA